MAARGKKAGDAPMDRSDGDFPRATIAISVQFASGDQLIQVSHTDAEHDACAARAHYQSLSVAETSAMYRQCVISRVCV